MVTIAPSVPRPRLQAESDWMDSLARAGAGHRYRIRYVLLSHVREACHQLGFHEGDEVMCLANARQMVALEAPSGHTVNIPRESAWFIRVEEAATMRKPSP